MILSLASALVGTLGYGVASVLQSLGAARATGPAVMRQPAYVAGLGCDVVAWVASLVALRALSLFAVQSLLAGSVAVTVVLARLFLGARLRGRDTVAIVVVVLASVGVAAAFGAQAAGPTPRGFTVTALVGVGVVSIALLATYRSAPAWLLALVAGAAYSVAALCARALGSSTSLRELATAPLVWAIVAVGIVGTMGYARSLERGAVGPATALLWVTEVVLTGTVGVAILGDGVRPGLGWLATASVCAAVAGCVVLASSPATALTGHPVHNSERTG